MAAIDRVRIAARKCDIICYEWSIDDLPSLISHTESQPLNKPHLWNTTSIGNLCHTLVSMHDKGLRLKVLSPNKWENWLLLLSNSKVIFMEAGFLTNALIQDIMEVMGQLYG